MHSMRWGGMGVANGVLVNTCFSSHATSAPGSIRSTPYYPYYLGVCTVYRGQVQDSTSVRKCERLSVIDSAHSLSLALHTVYRTMDLFLNHGSTYMHKFISFP